MKNERKKEYQIKEIRVKFNLNNNQDRLLWKRVRNFVNSYNKKGNPPLSFSSFTKALYAIFLSFSGIERGLEIEEELFSLPIGEEAPFNGEQKKEDKLFPLESVKGLLNKAVVDKE